jgi:hypothetical protein
MSYIEQMSTFVDLQDMVMEQLPEALRPKLHVTIIEADPYFLRAEVAFYDVTGPLEKHILDVKLERDRLPGIDRQAAWKLPDTALAYLCL